MGELARWVPLRRMLKISPSPSRLLSKTILRPLGAKEGNSLYAVEPVWVSEHRREPFARMMKISLLPSGSRALTKTMCLPFGDRTLAPQSSLGLWVSACWWEPFGLIAIHV